MIPTDTIHHYIYWPILVGTILLSAFIIWVAVCDMIQDTFENPTLNKIFFNMSFFVATYGLILFMVLIMLAPLFEGSVV